MKASITLTIQKHSANWIPREQGAPLQQRYHGRFDPVMTQMGYDHVHHSECCKQSRSCGLSGPVSALARPDSGHCLRYPSCPMPGPFCPKSTIWKRAFPMRRPNVIMVARGVRRHGPRRDMTSRTAWLACRCRNAAPIRWSLPAARHDEKHEHCNDAKVQKHDESETPPASDARTDRSALVRLRMQVAATRSSIIRLDVIPVSKRHRERLVGDLAAFRHDAVRTRGIVHWPGRRLTGCNGTSSAGLRPNLATNAQFQIAQHTRVT